MRLYADCIPCLLQIRFRDIFKLVEDENRRLEMVSKLLEVLHRLVNVERVISSVRISTELFRKVKELTGVEDPYLDEKRVANVQALELYRSVKKVVSQHSVDAKLEFVLRFSIAGNAIDFGVANYVPPKPDEVVDRARSMEIYGDIVKAIDLIKKAGSIVVLLDNAGEAVFDRLLGDVLREMGKQVFAVVKSAPFQNDITVKEVDEAGLRESFDDVLESGSDAASIFFEYLPEKTKRVLEDVDLVISKGMAHFEYLTDVLEILNKPVVFLLMAKCRPIAEELKVPIGAAVVYPYIPRSSA